MIVIHEMPGLTPTSPTSAAGCSTPGSPSCCPSLFGEPGRRGSRLRARQSFGAAASRRSSRPSPPRKTSPIATWLRALGPHAHAACGGPGRRRGRHVLHRRLRPRDDGRRPVIAPVLSQPSLPFPVHGGQRDVQLSRRRPRGVKDARRRRHLRARPALHRRHRRAAPSGSTRCAGSSATASSRSRSTRPRATRTASPSGPTRCSPAPRRRARSPHPRRPRPGPRVLPLPPRRARRRLTPPPTGCRLSRVGGHLATGRRALVDRLPSVPCGRTPGNRSRGWRPGPAYGRCMTTTRSMIAAVVLGLGGLALVAGCGGSSSGESDGSGTTTTSAATTTATPIPGSAQPADHRRRRPPRRPRAQGADDGRSVVAGTTAGARAGSAVHAGVEPRLHQPRGRRAVRVPDRWRRLHGQPHRRPDVLRPRR